MADLPVPVPLSPYDAATLFRAGTVLCFVALPAEPFAKTQWLGEFAVVRRVPFEEREEEAYFTAHPVAVWDPAFVNGPRPTPPEQTPTTIRAEVFTGGKIQNTPEPRVPVTLGDVVNVHAVLYDQNGAEMVPIEGMTWESNNTGYLTVEQLDLDDCAATMIRTGNVSCICRYANISGQINFAIAAPPEPLPAATSEVIILPGASNKLAIGGTIEAQTVFRDADGSPVAAPSPVAWTSSDETILTVVADPADSAKAIVTAVAAGTATISSATTAR